MKNALTTSLRNKLFLRGIGIGSLIGLVVGSIVAFELGSNSNVMRASMVRFIRRNKKTPVDYSKIFV